VGGLGILPCRDGDRGRDARIDFKPARKVVAGAGGYRRQAPAVMRWMATFASTFVLTVLAAYTHVRTRVAPDQRPSAVARRDAGSPVPLPE
jgi:hypothetical protein